MANGDYIKKLEQNLKKFKRALLVAMIGIFASISGNAYQYYVFSSHVAEDENSAVNYPLVDPARSIIKQKDFIVNIQPLNEQLNKALSDSGFVKTSLYFEYLNTGANISINPKTGIFPASLAKLPLAMVAVNKVEMGVWQWDNELVLLSEDIDMDSGNLYQKPVGTRFTIEELVRELLVNSDNTAYRILLRNMETSDLATVVNEVGLYDLFIEGGRISAKEYTRLFRALYSSSYLRRENSQKILEWLSQTPFNEYLASGLPEGVNFAHKIGENYEFNSYSDAGIVYLPNRPYLLALMVETQEEGMQEKEKVTAFMQTISSIIYEYVSSQ